MNEDVRNKDMLQITVMSDLHLSKKPYKVREAFLLAQGSDLCLITGDLVNDGTVVQYQRLQQIIEELMPETPVLAVSGNHDFPLFPDAGIREGICDFTSMLQWLLYRLPLSVTCDRSGAYAAEMGHTEVIGLNVASHFRRFSFREDMQLHWLEKHLADSRAQWHIIMCHAPLKDHRPRITNPEPYFGGSGRLQKILEQNKNILFLSGHTHISPESKISCAEYDRERNSMYLNCGSIRPTVLIEKDGHPAPESVSGNLMRLTLTRSEVQIQAYLTGEDRILDLGRLSAAPDC